MRRDGKGVERPPLPPGFAAIWTCVALDLIGFGIVIPILPRYAERFGASPATVGLLVGSFSLAQVLFSPLWGRVSDRIGRKPVLVLSLVGTAAGSLLTGLAGSLWFLFAGRVVDGISGASVAVAQAAVADVAPPEQRARLLGLLGAAFGLGFVAGPALGALAALRGPHVPFFIAAAIAAVNAVVAARRLPETHPGPGRAAGRQWAVPGIGALVAVAFVALVGFSAFETTFPVLTDERLGFREASIGVVFIGVGLVIVAVQVGLVHRVVAAVGEATTVRLGLALDAVGLLLLPTVHAKASLVAPLVFLCVGQGLVTPTLASMVAGRAGAARRGGALGIQQAAGGLARVVGPVGGGFAFQHIGVPAPYIGGAALMALGALLLRAAPVVTVQ